MTSIAASVGENGINQFSDVRIIQQLLNAHPFAENLPALLEDGLIGAKTIDRIQRFQADVVKMANPDGRIDPKGKTLAQLSSPPSQPNPTSSPSLDSQQLSPAGLDLLKKVESLRLAPYDDQTGQDINHWVRGATIGYGHLILADEWQSYQNSISKSQAEALLKKDLVPYSQAVLDAVSHPLQQNEFDALVILTFNIGGTNLRSSSVLKLINQPSAITNYPSLEAAWKAWNKSQGKVMQGLVNRRDAEWKIYSQGIYQVW